MFTMGSKPSTTMRMHVFIMCPNKGTSIDEIFQKDELRNIPKYLKYEGSYPQYLVCIDARINLKQFCERHNCTYTNHSKLHLEKSKYNNQHVIQPTYFKYEPYMLTLLENAMNGIIMRP